MKLFLARTRMLIAVLFDRPVAVRLPKPFGEATLFPKDGLVLPVVAGGAPEDDEDKDADADKDDESDADKDDAEDDEDKDADSEDDDGKEAKTDDSDRPNWEWQARKHERRAKSSAKKLAATEAKLRKREEADKSEQEKAVDKAREEGRTSALTEAEKERRSDRLEVAVTRLANKSIEIGDGDDKKKVRFADSDDALLYIERAISKGDIDPDDIFDEDNKVKADALKGELAELLESKPHYQARSDSADEGGKKKGKAAAGDGDQGKGAGSGSKDLEEMSAEDHFKRIKRDK